jgi:hypothetical protein
LAGSNPSNSLKESKEYTRHGSKLKERTDPLVYLNKARRFIAATCFYSFAYPKRTGYFLSDLENEMYT